MSSRKIRATSTVLQTKEILDKITMNRKIKRQQKCEIKGLSILTTSQFPPTGCKMKMSYDIRLGIMNLQK